MSTGKTAWVYSLDFIDPRNGQVKGGEFSGGDTRRECVRRLVRSLRHHRDGGVAEGRFAVSGRIQEVCKICAGLGEVPKSRRRTFAPLFKPCSACKKLKGLYNRPFTMTREGIQCPQSP